MKKKILVGSFFALLLATIIIFLVAAINTYSYEVANDDIMSGFGAALILIIGGYVVFYEIDLFYTVYYFLIKPKTMVKSTLNIISNLTLFLVFFTDSIAHFLYKHVSRVFNEEMIVLFALLFIYIVLRITLVIVSFKKTSKT